MKLGLTFSHPSDKITKVEVDNVGGRMGGVAVACGGGADSGGTDSR